MNKQCLDISQMQHLKELGVDTSKASMVLIYNDCYGNVVDWDAVIKEMEHPEPEMYATYLYDAQTGEYNKCLRSKYGN